VRISKFKEDLKNKGYTFIPELKYNRKTKLNLPNLKSTHSENTAEHLKYIQEKKIKEKIVPELLKIAQSITKAKLNSNDLYCITKVIRPMEKSVSDTGHFDSHIFTLVTPVRIPKSNSLHHKGQLVLFNNIRQDPLNELVNFFQKLFFYIFFSSPRGIKKLKLKKNYIEFDFKDYIPLLFLGRQCFHSSNHFLSKFNDQHILFITHFFDPSPKFSIGRINRFLRDR
jgi:hypothetical protein